MIDIIIDTRDIDIISLQKLRNRSQECITFYIKTEAKVIFSEIWVDMIPFAVTSFNAKSSYEIFIR